MTQLTERKRAILRLLVEEYIATGEPVGSKGLVERSGLTISASTVRNELAELESLGLLTHPHTSAGRVPTDSGYRFYADEALEQQEQRPERFPAQEISQGEGAALLLLPLWEKVARCPERSERRRDG